MLFDLRHLVPLKLGSDLVEKADVANALIPINPSAAKAAAKPVGGDGHQEARIYFVGILGGRGCRRFA